MEEYATVASTLMETSTVSLQADGSCSTVRHVAVKWILGTCVLSIALLVTATANGWAQSTKQPCIYQMPNGQMMITDDATDPNCVGGSKGGTASDVPSWIGLEAAEMIGVAHWMAVDYQVDHRLVEALIEVESGYDPLAVSSKGAMGLMQISEEVAQAYDVDNPFDVWENLDAGLRYLRMLLIKYDADLTLVLAAYNAGETAVALYGGVPPFDETRRYIERVLFGYHERISANLGS